MDNLDDIANDPLIEQKAIDDHLNIIHRARCDLGRYLLPEGEIILGILLQ